jgi:hypothetical protein
MLFHKKTKKTKRVFKKGLHYYQMLKRHRSLFFDVIFFFPVACLSACGRDLLTFGAFVTIFFDSSFDGSLFSPLSLPQFYLPLGIPSTFFVAILLVVVDSFTRMKVSFGSI